MRVTYPNIRKKSKFELLGEYFGFPLCCIDSFMHGNSFKTIKQHKGAPWLTTGFVPCNLCIESATENFEKYLAERVYPNRQSPFPLLNRSSFRIVRK